MRVRQCSRGVFPYCSFHQLPVHHQFALAGRRALGERGFRGVAQDRGAISARCRAALTPPTMKRATTPKTPDTFRSRAKTPEQSRRSSVAGPGASTAASRPESPPASKPKVFCEKDFNKFLARQDLHKAMQKKHHQVPNGLLAGLRATPLCPILSGNGYVIHGSIYVEADFRNKRQQGEDIPTQPPNCCKVVIADPLRFAMQVSCPHGLDRDLQARCRLAGCM